MRLSTHRDNATLEAAQILVLRSSSSMVLTSSNNGSGPSNSIFRRWYLALSSTVKLFQRSFHVRCPSSNNIKDRKRRGRKRFCKALRFWISSIALSFCLLAPVPKETITSGCFSVGQMCRYSHKANLIGLLWPPSPPSWYFWNDLKKLGSKLASVSRAKGMENVKTHGGAAEETLALLIR